MSEIKGKPTKRDREMEDLRAELAEARETLAAIQGGAVDALVIDTPHGQRIFTLEGAEHAYRALVENMREGAVMLNVDGAIHYSNRSFAQMLNRPLEQVIGSPMQDWIASEDRPALAAMLTECGGHKELSLIAQDGQTIPVFVSATKVQEGPEICLVLTDLTERKRHEARIIQLNAELEDRVLQRTAQLKNANVELARAADALRQSEQKYRHLFDRNPDGVFAVDLTGRFIVANPACELICGYSAAELQQMTFMQICAPDQMAQTAAHFEKNLRQPVYSQLETALVRKDGRRVEVWIAGEPIADENSLLVHCTVKDITQRRLAKAELRAAKISAEQAKATAETANRAKDHFLAVLSHELRTPLSPVVATISMLQDDPRFDPETRENLEMIRRNVELEARLIDDLLDVTRIERGKVVLDKQPIELGTVLRRAADVCMADIKAGGLDFAIDTDAQASYTVQADPGRLQQVLWNLLKNSIKFTPRGGCVGIRCRRDGASHVIVEVIDSGQGIAPEVLPSIFNAFEQGDRRITRQFGGLGLGLAISKAIAELHGGTLSARSEGKHKGATFALRLPLLEVKVAGADSPAAKAVSAPMAQRLRARILLVEDHSDTARIMRRLLTLAGHEVRIAGDLATALKLAREHSFDLLLSDLGLPDGSGLDLMRSLRNQGITLPGIALSGYGQDQDLQQSREAGFAEHIVKPVNLTRLAEAIARTVRIPTP